MHTILLVILLLFAALNLLGTAQSIRKSRLVAAGFTLAAAALVVAALTGSTAALVSGLLLGTLSPIGFGRWVLGENHRLHHLVRAAVCAGILVAWLTI
jgi:hypothetical protein